MKSVVRPVASAIQPTSSKSLSHETLSPGYIYLGVSKEVVPTLRDFGLDPDPLIRKVGLDPRLFDDEMSKIPFATLGQLYALCVARTHCPHFGLLVGQRASIQSLGFVSRLMQHSDTVGDALRTLVANLRLHDRAVVPSLTLSDATALLTFATYQAERTGLDQVLDAALGVVVSILRTLCASTWTPIEVLVPRGTPADTKPYRRHFVAPVRFNQETAALVFPAGDLDRRIAGADPVMRALLEERLEHDKGAQGPDFSDDIRRLLRTRLTSKRCSVADVAEMLSVHRRTLSRRLNGAGINFRAIANQARFEIARQLLEDTDISLGQIAAALGYSEASAFTRAFGRWSGQTPSAWRAATARVDLRVPTSPVSVSVKHKRRA